MNANESAVPRTDHPPVPDPAELAPSFPSYEIQTLLGRGGMGAVYRARHRKLDRMVAIKVLLPALDDPEFAERFEREARALARLSHPGIVSVHDFGEADGRYFLVMEYVEGASLRELMAQQRLTPRDAMALVPQICDALQYAHDAGVVHRDIKPENILVDQDGRARIADFGLAKMLRGEQVSIGLTRTHQVMGTPHYMAPEQIGGSGQVDHRADLYSLGVLLYEMLTGELPIGRFAPPSAKSQAGADLDAVVMKSLESEPAKRYQQAREVKSDLKEGGASTESQADSTPRGRPRAATTPRAEVTRVGRPVVPWGTWGMFLLVLMSTFMSWGSIVPDRSSSAIFPAQLLGEIEVTAWNGTVMGIPCWVVLFAAATIAVLRTARMHGIEIRRLATIVPGGLGLLISAAMFFLLATAGAKGSPGIGSFVSMCCFGAWVLLDVSGVHDARQAWRGTHRRSRRRRHRPSPS